MIELNFDGKDWWIRTGKAWYSPDVGMEGKCSECGGELRLFCMCAVVHHRRIFDAWVCTGKKYENSGYLREVEYTSCYYLHMRNDYWRKVESWWPPPQGVW